MEALEAAIIRCPVTIEVDEEGYNRIIDQLPGEEPAAFRFQGFLNGLVADFVGGGLMLSPEDMSRIRDSAPDAGPDEIIKAVAESAGMSEGQMVVRWTVDPSYWEPLRAIAEAQSMEVEQVIQNLMDNAVNGGWFYDLNALIKPIAMTAEEYAEVGELIGIKEFGVADLIKHIRALSAEPELSDLLSEPEPVRV